MAGVADQPTEATFEAWLADQTIAKLREFAVGARGDEPFFLACHLFGPHLPYPIPRQWYDLLDPEAVELPGSFAETFTGKPLVQQAYAEYVANPEGIDEFYDLHADPDELVNAVNVPVYVEAVAEHRLRLYRELVRRGDRFTQWLAFSAGIPEEERVRPETAVENLIHA